MTVVEYKDEPLQPSRYAIFRWFGFDQFVPERAVTSWWLSSKTFFCIRFMLALYSTIVIWANIGNNAHQGTFRGFFAFFTNLTFVGLHAYLITSVVHHARYLYSGNADSFLKQYTFLNYLYLYLYSTIVTFNIVTPIVYWSILAKGLRHLTVLSTWINDSVHGVSLALMMIDVLCNRMKLPLRMICFAFGTVVLYMLLAFVIYACNHYWVYPFLDWSQGGKAAIWYIVVGVIAVVAFLIQVGIHWLRDFVARKTGKAPASQHHNEKVESSYQEAEVEKNNSSIV